MSVWNKATESFAIINATSTTQSKIVCSRIFQSGSPQENGIQLEDEHGSLFTIFYDVARDLVLPFGTYIANLVATMPSTGRQVNLVTFEIEVTNLFVDDLGAGTTINGYVVLPVKNLAVETITVPVRTLPLINLS